MIDLEDIVVRRPADRWDILWIDQAQRYAEESKDRSTKVGAILVNPNNKANIPLSQGWNGFPRGVDDTIESRHVRPEKHLWVIHAELNAILNHARNGGPGLEGSVCYLNYAPGICSNCMGCLWNAGIVRCVGPNEEFPGIEEREVEHAPQYSDILSPTIAKETGMVIEIVDYVPRRNW